MTNIAQKTKTDYQKHMDWYKEVKREKLELSLEEVIKGIQLIESGPVVCDWDGDGDVNVDPILERYVYLKFDPDTVKDLYMRLEQVEWPRQVDDLSSEELYSMFLKVRDYMDVDYYNVFTEDKVLTIYASETFDHGI